MKPKAALVCLGVQRDILHLGSEGTENLLHEKGDLSPAWLKALPSPLGEMCFLRHENTWLVQFRL